MNETDKQREDALVRAGEYVLGTIDEDVRADFEKNRSANAVLCKHADDWERDLSRLTDALPDVTPPANAWQIITGEISGTGTVNDLAKGSQWRFATFILGGVSLILLVLLILSAQ